MWPLFAQMLAGSWLAIPWFLLNGELLGSSMRRREWACAAASLLGSALLVWGIALAADAHMLDRTGIRLALLAVVALKMGMAYAIFSMQSQTFEIWQHFGGKEKPGWVVVILGALFRSKLEVVVGTNAIVLVVLS